MEWFKENRFVRCVKCVELEIDGDKSIFLIFKVILEDFGNYCVEVINLVGKVVKFFIVKVNG